MPETERPPLELTCSRHFTRWLAECGISLACTTYQTNRVFLIGVKADGSLSAHERAFDRPMGLTVDAGAERFHVTTRSQIWRFDNALPAGIAHEGYDRVYVPRVAYTTGDLDAHDVAIDGRGRLVFVNTAYSCLATLSERYSFTPLWRPSFISQLVAEDRCHLNGLAMADGAPAYVTAVSRSDVTAGWRDRRADGGLVLDVEDGEIVIEALSMPHSPRIHGSRLWVLNSGTGELGWVDRSLPRFEPVAFCPGFLRGLAFCGDFAIVGLSKPRHDRTFSGLALDDTLRRKDAEARCGLWVIDLRDGTVAHWLQFDGVVVELYDVAVLPGVRRPMALGIQNDDIHHWITIDAAPAPVLHLTAGKHGSQRAAPAPFGLPPRREQGSGAEADAALRRATAIAARDPKAAIAQFEIVLRHVPTHPEALAGLGAVQARLGLYRPALETYRRAVAADPTSCEAHVGLGALLHQTGALAEAVEALEAAGRLRPDRIDVLIQLGLCLGELGRLDAAADCFSRALTLDPASAQAANNLGAVRKMQGRADEALRLHARAAALDPGCFEAHDNTGKVCEEAGRTGDAIAAYRRALAVRQDPHLALHASLLCPPIFDSADALAAYRQHAEAVLDTWEGHDVVLPLERAHTSRAEPPYDWTYHGYDTLPLKRRYAALFTRGLAHPVRWRRGDDARLHVGFVVTPGHEGVFARCMSGIVNRLDRSRFRVTLVCARSASAGLRTALPEQVTPRLFLPTRVDHAAAALTAAGFDALYHWEVGTDSTNYFLPFLRLAPLQCSGWGWPDTSAAPELDVHLTSTALADADSDAAYSESLVRLPELPPYFHRPAIPPSEEGRRRFALPPDATLYVCPQNLRKLHPSFDAVLADILGSDRRGLLLLVADQHPVLAGLLQQRWRATLGELLERVLMLPRLTPPDYLQLVATADVILDTPHFGGAISSYDAFAAGTPVITLPGRLPRGRYAAAMHRIAGTVDCIAESAADYAARAVRIASDRPYRQRLATAIVDAAPQLFENAAAVTQLEAFFEARCSGHAASVN